MKAGFVLVTNRNLQDRGQTKLSRGLGRRIGIAWAGRLAIKSRRRQLARAFFLILTAVAHATTIMQEAGGGQPYIAKD